MSLEKCSKFLSLPKGLRKLKSLTSTSLSEPDTLSARLLSMNANAFAKNSYTDYTRIAPQQFLGRKLIQPSASREQTLSPKDP